MKKSLLCYTALSAIGIFSSLTISQAAAGDSFSIMNLYQTQMNKFESQEAPLTLTPTNSTYCPPGYNHINGQCCPLYDRTHGVTGCIPACNPPLSASTSGATSDGAPKGCICPSYPLANALPGSGEEWYYNGSTCVWGFYNKHTICPDGQPPVNGICQTRQYCSESTINRACDNGQGWEIYIQRSGNAPNCTSQEGTCNICQSGQVPNSTFTGCITPPSPPPPFSPYSPSSPPSPPSPPHSSPPPPPSSGNPCTNGAINSPACNACPSGENFPTLNGIPDTTQHCICSDGATNVPACNICQPGYSMQTINGIGTLCWPITSPPSPPSSGSCPIASDTNCIVSGSYTLTPLPGPIDPSTGNILYYYVQISGNMKIDQNDRDFNTPPFTQGLTPVLVEGHQVIGETPKQEYDANAAVVAAALKDCDQYGFTQHQVCKLQGPYAATVTIIEP